MIDPILEQENIFVGCIEVVDLGIQGVAGESAYQYAIRTGKFVGTEEEWYASFADVANDKVDKELGKSLVSDLEIAKLLTIEEGAQKNVPFTGLATEQFVADGLALKVDKENGKSLISDLEIVRLQNVFNQTRTSLNIDLVDNTADINKPISNPQNAGLLLKVDKESGKSLIADSEILRLVNITNQTKASLGIENVNNTSDPNKPISNAQNLVNNAKLDKVTAVDVEKIYVKNADGTQGMRPFTDFAGGGGIDPSVQQNISGTVVATELMKNKVLIVTADTNFTIGNTILSKDWTVRVIVKNGTFEPRKGTTRVWSLGNPDPVIDKASDFTIRQEGTTSNLLVSGKILSSPFIAYFDTTKTDSGGSASNQLKLTFSNAVIIDFADGDLVSTSTTVTKTFPTAGVKLVKIYGSSITLSFRVNSGDASKIGKVLNYGNLLIDRGAFYKCKNLDMSQAQGVFKLGTSLNLAFSITSKLATINNIELADFSVVTNMSGAFRFSLFNQDIGFANVSNVSTFEDIFGGKTPEDYSILNYDSLLNGWTDRKFALPSLTFGFGTLKRSVVGTESRDLMTRPYTLKTITNAVNNGSGLVRVTANAHGLTTNNKIFIQNVVGGMGINKAWIVTVIDVNTIDLKDSLFSTAYVSGGEIVTGWGHSIIDGGI